VSLVIDFAAGEPHFADHLAPIYAALEPHERGRFFALGDGMVGYLARVYGIAAEPALRLELGWPVVVASWGDLRAVTEGERRVPRPGGKPGVIVRQAGMSSARTQPRVPVVFVEHGAGQTYRDTDSPSYAGGRRRDAVRLYLAPGDHVARNNAARYPDTPTEVVGCPKLDRWHLEGRPPARRGAELGRRPAVAVSFHPDFPHIAPECLSAFSWYRDALASLAAADRPYDLLGHAHPRRWPELRAWWAGIGVEPVERFDEVVARADCYVVDNSSTLYEFASLDRPVVALDAPWMRRSVEHGLRFWSHADVGVRIGQASALDTAIRLALTDPAEIADRRRRLVADVYAHVDGHAADRAVDAIRRHAYEWRLEAAGPRTSAS